MLVHCATCGTMLPADDCACPVCLPNFYRPAAIPPEDIKVETLRQPSKGGQHVGVPPCDVRVTHIPTGITATVGFCRSQYRNRIVAVNMIEAAITDPELR